MKKTAANPASLVILIFTAWPFYPALAQTLSVPATQQIISPALKTLSVQPSVINLSAAPLTAEAPAGTAAGAPSQTSTTQQTTETSGKTSGRAAGTMVPGTQETSTEINLPQPVLPVLDLGSTGQQQTAQTQENTQCSSAIPSSCLDPATASESVLPPVIGNQVKVSLMVFLGASLGMIMWLLCNIMVNSARSRRETARLERQTRSAIGNLRLESLSAAYSPVSRCLNDLIKTTDKKVTVNHQALADYKSAAVPLELFASKETLTAHNALVALLSKEKAPSPDELDSARNSLLSSLQHDLKLHPVPNPGEQKTGN